MDERIKELAEQAGFKFIKDWGECYTGNAQLEHFAELVRQDERNACIEIVMKNASLETAWKCEEEIRARGNT